VQKKASEEGARNAVILATGGGEIVFNGLGRPLGAGNLTQIDITNTQGGACQAAGGGGGPMRCLRLLVSTGGGVKMCDPIVVDATDPRICAP
jgi:type IV fimbrial biogenesis protein FimT